MKILRLTGLFIALIMTAAFTVWRFSKWRLEHWWLCEYRFLFTQ